MTVSGPGGSGKTSLALETGRRLEVDRTFAGGVWLLDLSTVADDEAALLHVAHVVGVRQTGDSLLDAIRSRVRDTIHQPTLFIVDNVEQLAGIGRTLGGLLDGSGALTLLVTSRRLLRVGGEFNFVTAPWPCRHAGPRSRSKTSGTCRPSRSSCSGRLRSIQPFACRTRRLAP